VKRQPSWQVKKEIRLARKALQNFMDAIDPLFRRIGEGSYKAPSTLAAQKAMGELSLRFAAQHGLVYMAEAVEQIAKLQGFSSGADLLEYHGCRSGYDDSQWIPRVIAKLNGRETWTKDDLNTITRQEKHERAAA